MKRIKEIKYKLYSAPIISSFIDLIPEDSILFFDLEVYPEVNDLSDKYTIISAAFSINNRDFIYTGNEKTILKMFNDMLLDRPIYLTVGYGSIYFDIPLLMIKLRQYDLPMLRRVLSATLHLDLAYPTSLYLYAIGKISELKFIPLHEVAQMLGFEKDKFSQEIYKDENKLREYSKKDLNAIKTLFSILKNEFFKKL